MFKNILKIILTVAIVFAVVFVASNVYKNKKLSFDFKPIETLRQKINSALPKSKCGNLVHLSVGQIDSRFKISKEELAKSIEKAEAMWEQAANKNIFDITANGNVPVNLVFDGRQADTDRLKTVLGGISSEEGKLDAVKAEYNKLALAIKAKDTVFKAALANYQEAQKLFASSLESYNQKMAAYDQQVEFWNNKGGAPKKEYEKLVQEQLEIAAIQKQLEPEQEHLKQMYDSLKVREDEYNSLVAQLNNVAEIYNRLSADVNKKVGYYNEIRGEREEFVTGLYISGGGEERIDIFQYYDQDDLVLTIAHEMGHALGLDHATSLYSIMYPKTEGQKMQISTEDLNMLNAVCAQN